MGLAPSCSKTLLQNSPRRREQTLRAVPYSEDDGRASRENHTRTSKNFPLRIPLTDLGPRGSRISGLGSCGLRSLQISNLEPCQSRSLRLADAPNPRIEFGRGYAPAHPRKECRGVFGLACRHCNKVPVSPETQAIFAANPDSCEIL